MPSTSKPSTTSSTASSSSYKPSTSSTWSSSSNSSSSTTPSTSATWTSMTNSSSSTYPTTSTSSTPGTTPSTTWTSSQNTTSLTTATSPSTTTSSSQTITSSPTATAPSTTTSSSQNTTSSSPTVTPSATSKSSTTSYLNNMTNKELYLFNENFTSSAEYLQNSSTTKIVTGVSKGLSYYVTGGQVRTALYTQYQSEADIKQALNTRFSNYMSKVKIDDYGTTNYNYLQDQYNYYKTMAPADIVGYIDWFNICYYDKVLKTKTLLESYREEKSLSIKSFASNMARTYTDKATEINSIAEKYSEKILSAKTTDSVDSLYDYAQRRIMYSVVDHIKVTVVLNSTTNITIEGAKGYYAFFEDIENTAYKITGYYKDPAFATPFDTKQALNEDITLYATYELKDEAYINLSYLAYSVGDNVDPTTNRMLDGTYAVTLDGMITFVATNTKAKVASTSSIITDNEVEYTPEYKLTSNTRTSSGNYFMFNLSAYAGHKIRVKVFTDASSYERYSIISTSPVSKIDMDGILAYAECSYTGIGSLSCEVNASDYSYIYFCQSTSIVYYGFYIELID